MIEALVLIWLSIFTLWVMLRVARVLRDDRRERDGGIFKDAGPIQGGAVAYAVEDHPIWGAPVAPTRLQPTFEEALGVVLAVGTRLRRCTACSSPATEIEGNRWDWNSGEVWLEVTETCMECDATSTYHVTADFFVAIEAMRLWEQARTAKVAAEQMIANRMEADRDALNELDGTLRERVIQAAKDAGIPVALMLCTICQQYLEPRDGKGACVCLAPMVVEG